MLRGVSRLERAPRGRQSRIAPATGVGERPARSIACTELNHDRHCARGMEGRSGESPSEFEVVVDWPGFVFDFDEDTEHRIFALEIDWLDQAVPDRGSSVDKLASYGLKRESAIVDRVVWR